MDNMNWHRLLGLVLTEYFTGSPFDVELEKDLSLRQQFLDVVVVRKRSGLFLGRLPDGLDNFGNFNLISFKSYQEAFDAWTMKELLGHYVNYRKHVSHSLANLLPEDQFRLYGLCARFPMQLAGQLPLRKLNDGVYECVWGTDLVRLLVLRDLPQEEHNAPLHLFSADRSTVQYGKQHYRRHFSDTSTLLNRLLARYEEEGVTMPYTMDDFRREVRREVLEGMSPEEILASVPVEERLRGLPVEERLRGLPVEERLRGLPVEERLRGLPVEERLKGLSAQELLSLENYLKKLRQESESAK